MRLIRTHKFQRAEEQKFIRQYAKWPVVNGLYDQRECQDCYATITGKTAAYGHWQWHKKQHAWDWDLIDALQTIAKRIGVRLVLGDEEDAGEPADTDERLTGKARTVLNHGDWDDASGGGEAPVVGGVVIGSGQLPDEMRGGNE